MNGVHDPIWEGIYTSFAEAGGRAEAFESQRWIERVTLKAREAVDRSNDEEFVNANSETKDYILPVVVALHAASARGSNTLSILDVGGGLAASYFPVVACLPKDVAVEFHIIENEILCRHGRELLREVPNVQFHSEMPSGRFEIVHAGSSLHYFENWRDELARVLACQPHYLVLSDLQAGQIPTYVTNQLYYGQKIPVWFLNIDEVLEAVSNMRYRLIYKCLYVAKIRGICGPKPMENFPASYRISHDCHLVFKQAD